MAGPREKNVTVSGNYTVRTVFDVVAPLRIGVIADTHGILDDRILEVLRGCDAVAHAGDVGADEVVDALNSLDIPVWMVGGNNDLPSKWRGHWPRLASGVEVELAGGLLVVLHGDKVLPAAQRHALLRERFAHARAVVYGHSHHLVVDNAASPWILNPGAAGRARTFGGPSCLTVDITLDGAWSVHLHKFALLKRTRS